MKKNVVANLISEYLISNQTYIYDQLIGHEDKYKIVVISGALFPGRENFPFKPVHAMVPYSRVYSRLVRFNEEIVNKLLNKYLKFWIRREKVNLLHAHFGTFGSKLVDLKDEVGKPLIVSFYGDDASSAPQKKEWKERYKKMFERAEGFIAICEDMKRELVSHGCPESKIHIVHVATDLEKYTYQERGYSEKVKFLMIARFEEKKGVPFLLRSFNKLRKEKDNVELTLLGYGPDLEKIKNMIAELGMEGIVNLIDTTEVTKTKKIFPLIKKLLSEKHIFVHPSVTTENNDKEGTPTIIMAASSSGMPIISTKHAGIPEVVIDGKTGFLVPERDTEALYARMKYLAEHPELWNRMGREGRLYMEKEFSRKSLTKNIGKIYEKYL